MTKSFRCRDAGVVCRAEITGDTENDVLEQAIVHARELHGVDLTDSQTLSRYAQSLIRDVGEPVAATDEARVGA